MAVLTSQFFLSDEEGELEMPLRFNGGRASLQQEVDFNYNCPQKMKQVEKSRAGCKPLGLPPYN